MTMYSDYKTTATYFVVIIAFCYSVYIANTELVSIIIIPMIIMWLILKTNSKALIKDIVEALKIKWENK